MVLRQERTLLIVVGCTSAEGNEKSQYRENVFCHGFKDKKYILVINNVGAGTTYWVG